jgi:hypothetical protein
MRKSRPSQHHMVTGFCRTVRTWPSHGSLFDYPMCCLLLPRNTPPPSNPSMWWSRRDPTLTTRGHTHVRSQGIVKSSNAYLLHAKQAEVRGPWRYPGVTSRGRVRDHLSHGILRPLLGRRSLLTFLAISRSLPVITLQHNLQCPI